MTFEVGDMVQFERDRGEIVTGRVTSVQGGEPYRVIGVRGPGLSENYLIPERHLARLVVGPNLRGRASDTRQVALNLVLVDGRTAAQGVRLKGTPALDARAYFG